MKWLLLTLYLVDFLVWNYDTCGYYVNDWSYNFNGCFLVSYQLVEKDPEKAIPLFWAAINAGDRVDSALKDMAIVMKQQNRAEEANKSLWSQCSKQSQESLNNILLDLYKVLERFIIFYSSSSLVFNMKPDEFWCVQRCGRLDDQIGLLWHKLFLIHQGLAFNGKRTKTARSQGKKF